MLARGPAACAVLARNVERETLGVVPALLDARDRHAVVPQRVALPLVFRVDAALRAERHLHPEQRPPAESRRRLRLLLADVELPCADGHRRAAADRPALVAGGAPRLERQRRQRTPLERERGLARLLAGERLLVFHRGLHALDGLPPEPHRPGAVPVRRVEHARRVALLELRRRARARAVHAPLHGVDVGAVDLAQLVHLGPRLAVEPAREEAVPARAQLAAHAGAVEGHARPLAVAQKAGVDATHVAAHRGKARPVEPLAEVQLGRRLPGQPLVGVGGIRRVPRQPAVGAAERAAGVPVARRELAEQAGAVPHIEREVGAAQAVVAVTRAIVHHGRAERELVAHVLRDAAAGGGLLPAVAGRLVVDLDRHRVALEPAGPDHAAVVPDAGDRTRELHPALELLHDHVDAGALRNAREL